MSETGTEGADGSRFSRRRFVQAVGATSAVGVVGTAGAQDGTTIQWAADQLAADNVDALREGLRAGGLSEDVQVEVLAGAWETGQRQSQYQQWLGAGRTQPDVLNLDNGWHQPFIVRDQLLNLSEAMDQSFVDRITDEFLDLALDSAASQDGDLYGVPLFIDVPTMQYRRDLVEEAGFDPSGWATEPLTWQRFSEVVSQTQEEAGTQYGFTFQAQAYEGLACCNFPEYMRSYGGAYFGGPDNLYGPVGDRPVTVSEEPVVESLRALRSLVHGPDAENTLDGVQGVAPEAVLQWTEEPSRQPFTNGDAVAHRNWPYAIEASGSEENFGEDLGVMPLPYGVEEGEGQAYGGSTPAMGGWNVGVNPNSENQDAALQVVEAMASDEFQMRKFEAIGWAPPKPSLLASQEARDIEIFGRYMDTIEASAERAVPRPATAVWPQESTRISQAVNDVLSGGQAPEQALAQLSQAIEQIEQSV